MKPAQPVVEGFAGQEIIYARDQNEYLPLAAVRRDDLYDPKFGVIVTRWKMTWRERIMALLHGNVFVQVMTFNEPVQPLKLGIEPNCEVE